MPRRFPLCCVTLVLAAACDDSVKVDESLMGPFSIQPATSAVTLGPFEQRQISVQVLGPRGEAAPTRIVEFSIIATPGQPDDAARGATLRADRAITDDDGRASLTVKAGLPTVFQVRVSTSHAPSLFLTVMVHSNTHGPVEIAPALDEDVDATPPITTARLFFLDDHTCDPMPGGVVAPTGGRPARSVPIDVAATFTSVALAGHHAVFGLGMSQDGILRASGCVEVPGTSLLPHSPVRVLLPLHQLRPSPIGEFRATTHLQVSAPLPPIQTITDAWKALSECPLDPGRLWLDCTVDAFRTDEATDPLDCRPAADEGLTAAKLAARRGVLLTAMPGRCRDRFDSAGNPSLEALVQAMFPTERVPLLDDLPALGREAQSLLDAIQFQSTITVSATGFPEQFLVDHRLRVLELPLGAGLPAIDLSSLGSPVLTSRFVPATLKRNELQIGPHAFTLRLGSVARLGFLKASIAARGAPPDLDAFVPHLFSLASRPDRNTRVVGCAALDALSCAEIGQARGCLMSACLLGFEGLARTLDAGFAALERDGLDFQLSGSVPVIDVDGDRKADLLGRLGQGAGAAGAWTGELRLRRTISRFSATWAAERVSQ